MTPTAYPYINALLARLHAEMQGTLGDKLVGLYLYGSLVTGDFDEGISDIDLTAVLSANVDEHEFVALQRMHAAIAHEQPAWNDRIEVCYISLAALNTVTSQQHPIVNISPGEPFHRLLSRREWLMNWYLIREHSLTLFGPPPATIIEPITHQAFLQSVRDHARAWQGWITEQRTRGAQAYAILTLCRALYTCSSGEQASKRQAALWAAEILPEWSALIRDALVWRQTQGGDQDGESSESDTVRFVNTMVARILAAPADQAPGATIRDTHNRQPHA